MGVLIRRAAADDGDRLRDIAVAARGVWGYKLDSVCAWAETLDLTPDALRSRAIIVAEVHGDVVGWACAFARDDVWWLDDLWVEPSWMRQKIGSQLFDVIAEYGRAAGFKRFEWETEQGAIGFYERMGAHYTREGDHNPVMGMQLNWKQ